MSIVKNYVKYSFVLNLDRCAGSCSTLDYLSSRVCVPNATEDLNLHVFNMITKTNKWRILTKHISCTYECKFCSNKYHSLESKVEREVLLMIQWSCVLNYGGNKNYSN